MNRSRFLAAVAGVLIVFLNTNARASDLIYFKPFDTYADKSSLMIEWGTHENNPALKISFGPGLAARTVGIVFAENAQTDKNKILTAKNKLAELLNSFKGHTLTGDHLTKNIGLTFKNFVHIDKVK